jgi:hypothetical protein
MEIGSGQALSYLTHQLSLQIIKDTIDLILNVIISHINVAA